jgi:hypothetical protein
MSKKIGLFAAAALLTGIAPALAQNATCTEPVAPAMVDGATVAQAELVKTIAQVKDFIAKSDVYQQCISDDLEAKKQAAAKANTPFDASLQQVALAKVAANQQAKDKAAKDINTQIAAFKAKAAK